MAEHDVELKISHPINIAHKDVEFPVKVDGKPLGRLQISKGSIDWVPSPKSKSGHWLSWGEFADVMANHGHAK